jgi:hypothetical protein
MLAQGARHNDADGITTCLLRRWKGHCPISFSYTLVDCICQQGYKAPYKQRQNTESVLGRIKD